MPSLPATPRSRVPWWLRSCFLLSGVAGLVYQTSWSQELTLVLGASDLAVATVLAAFMGGLALGAALAARRSLGLRRPILVYALLELGIAASALALPAGLALVARLQLALLRGAELAGGGSLAFYLLASALLLLVPTALMGATLPVLVRGTVGDEAGLGRAVGGLYMVNTLGAALGAVLGAFVLLPRLGLGHATWVGIGLNGLAAALAAAYARRGLRGAAAAGRAVPAAWSWALPAMLVGGLVSFSWEIVWTRLLNHLAGGSIYAFGTMLATFLVGLALGAWAAQRWSGDGLSARRGFALAQLGVAVASWSAYHLLDRWPAWLTALGLGPGNLVAAGALASALSLLPGALFLGATYPLAVRIVARAAAEAASASGRVLAWNTAGAIAGALVSGLFLLPALGFARLATAAIAVSLGLALVAAVAERPRLPRHAMVAVALLAALLLALPREPLALLSWSAVAGPQRGTPVYLGVGRSATVLLLERSDGWRLLTNGLPEALILKPEAPAGMVEAAGWMALLPSLLRPQAKSLLVVGLGGGVILESVPPGIEHLEVVELEPEVVAANRRIAGQRRRDPLSDPRLRLTVQDARSVLALASQRYDAIVSQPSHPWTAASAHLFSVEMFRLVASRLGEEGVFVQWMGLAFVDHELLRSLLVTLLAVFPEVEVYQPGGGPSLLLVAGARPLAPRDLAARLAASPGWAELGVLVPEDLAVGRLLTTAGVRAFAAGAPINRDHYNRLQAGAPRVLGTPGLTAGGLDAMLPWDPLDGTTSHPLYCLRRLLAAGNQARAARLAAAIGDPVARRVAAGLLQAAAGHRAAAEAELRAAHAQAPADPEPLYSLLDLYLDALKAGRRLELAEELPTAEDRLLVAALLAAARGDWPAVAAADGVLAALSPYHPLRAEAVRLRVRWRLRTPGRATEARAILAAELGGSRQPADQLLAAEAALGAGDADGALVSLGALLERTAREHRALDRPGLERLDEVERLLRAVDGGDRAREVAEIRQRLARLRSGE